MSDHLKLLQADDVIDRVICRFVKTGDRESYDSEFFGALTAYTKLLSELAVRGHEVELRDSTVTDFS